MMKGKAAEIKTYIAAITAAIVLVMLSGWKLDVKAADIAAGTSGTCTWAIAEDGTFSIYPTNGKSGTMDGPKTQGSWPWEKYRSQITAISINRGTVYAPEDCYMMFYCMNNATKMDISSLDTSHATNMSYMFSSCSMLPEFDLSHFDVSNVLYFNNMLNNCTRAEKIDIHGWDMTKNTKYTYTGGYSSSRTEEQVSNMFFNAGQNAVSMSINANNVKFPRNSARMFFYAYPTELHMDNVDFSEVYDFEQFLNAEWKNMKELKITNIGTVEHVGSMNYMFAETNSRSQSLKTMILKGFSGAKAVTNLNYMFRGQEGLTTLDYDLTTGNQLTTINSMFQSCNSLSYIDLTGLDVSNPNFEYTSLGSPGRSGQKLTINISGWDMSAWTNDSAKMGASIMSPYPDTIGIANNIKLPRNSYTDMNRSNVQINEPFYGIGSSQVLAHDVDFSGIASLYYFFSSSIYGVMPSGSLQPRKIDFTAVNTDGIKYLNYAFVTEKKDIYSLDLTWIKGAKIVSMKSTFGAPLKSVDMSTLDTTQVTDDSMKDAFTNCAETIQTIVLGQKTVLRSSAGLPDVRWVCQETAEALSTEQLIEKTQTDGGAPGTWRVSGRQSYISLSDNIYNVLDHSDYTESTDQDGNTIRIPGNIKDGEDPRSLYQDLINGGGYWQKLSNDLWAYHFFVFDNNTVWKIWEDPVSGYKSSNPSDNIIEVQGKKVAELEPEITNTKKVMPKTGQLSLTKKVVDTDTVTTLKTDQTFVFTITLTGDGISGSQIFGETAFTDGKATVTLSADETIVFTNIPVDTIYSVQELETAGFTGSIDNSTGTISEEASSIICTNIKTEESKKETSSFAVAKQVSSNADETKTEFQFHAILADLLPYQTYTLSDGTEYKADVNGNADVSFRLKDNESIRFLQMPVGCRYQIMEEAGNYLAAYRITDSAGIGKIVSTQGAASSVNQSLATQQEVLDKEENVTVWFVNTITRTENLTLTKNSMNSKGEPDTSDNNQYAIDIYISGLTEYQKIATSDGMLASDDEGIIETTLYISPTQKIVFYDLPVGSKYQFTEQKNDKIGSVRIISETNIKGTVVAAEKSNTEAEKEISTAEETVGLGETVTVTFNNKTPNAAKLKVIKYDGNASKKKLGGAEFALYKSDGTPVNFASGGKNIITIGSNGESELLESPLFVPGSYYLIETKAPDGYTVSGEPKAFQITADDAGKTLQIEVYDNKLVVFPVTGGAGNGRILSIALVLAAATGSALIYKKRRETAA